MQLPEKFKRFLVDNVKEMIMQYVKTNDANKLLSLVSLHTTVA